MLKPSQVIRAMDFKVCVCDVDFDGWHMMIDQNKAELFFVDRVVLAEGFTDSVVYSSLLQSRGVKPERHNFSLLHIYSCITERK
ncbi:MAG: hypothetical protein N3D14_03790 [Aquificaceae bacterium]|nr:hypothetical protein [Aquificaceae bacterium]